VSTENVAVVRRVHDAFGEIGLQPIRDALAANPDVDAAAEAVGRLAQVIVDSVDPDVELELNASEFSLPDMPTGSVFRGLEGWAAFWRVWLEPWEEFDFEYGNIVDGGDDVVLDIAIAARGRGSGAPTRIAQSQVWTVRDRKVVRVRVFDTRAEALAAAGLADG
jgi:ketosteroid isomerase-like protein